MKKLAYLLILSLCLNGLTGVASAWLPSAGAEQKSAAKSGYKTEAKSSKKKAAKDDSESDEADAKADKQKKEKKKSSEDKTQESDQKKSDKEKTDKEKDKNAKAEKEYSLDLQKNSEFLLSMVLEYAKLGIKLEQVKAIELEDKEDKKRIAWEKDEENEKDYVITVLKSFKKLKLRIVTKKGSKLIVLLNGEKAKKNKTKEKDQKQQDAEAVDPKDQEDRAPEESAAETENKTTDEASAEVEGGKKKGKKDDGQKQTDVENSGPEAGIVSDEMSAALNDEALAIINTQAEPTDGTVEITDTTDAEAADQAIGEDKKPEEASSDTGETQDVPTDGQDKGSGDQGGSPKAEEEPPRDGPDAATETGSDTSPELDDSLASQDPANEGQGDVPEGQTEVGEGQTEVGEGQTEVPEGKTEDPEGKTEDPEGKTEDPEAKTEDPEDKTEDPEAKTEDPEGKTEDPEGKTEDPEGKTEDPEGKTEDPEGKTEDPEGKTEDPEGKTEDPEGKTEDPEGKTEDPEAKTEDPETKTEDPEGKTEDPEAKTEDPEDKTEDPEGKTEDPEGKTEDPEGKTEDPEGSVEDPEGQGDAGTVIPAEAEAWFKRDSELFWGTLEAVIGKLTGGETVYIQSADVMLIEEAPLQLLSTVTLLPDESVFKGSYRVCISTEDPAVVSEPALIETSQFAEMGEKANLYVWVGQSPSTPEDDTPEEEEEEDKPELVVEVTGLPESGWSSTQPQFTLSGIPEGKDWSYAAIIYDERIVPITANTYAPDLEGIYTLRFAMLDELGDIMSASDQYTLQLDWTAPEVSIEADEETSFTLNITASDTASGVDAVSVDAGKKWHKMEDGSYTVTEKEETTFAEGDIMVRDNAGNVFVSDEEYTVSEAENEEEEGEEEGEEEAEEGGGGGGGGGGGSGTPALPHASGDGEEGSEYDAVTLDLPDEPMKQLMVGGEPMALTLVLASAQEKDAPVGANQPFTAQLRYWEDASDSDTDNTLVLTAEMDHDLGDAFAYEWRFNGEVYRILANSGIRYVALKVGDAVVAFPTEGFTGGTRYTELKMQGVSTRRFNYTLTMRLNLDPSHISAMTESDFSQECDLSIHAEVEDKNYELSSSPQSMMYFYDVFVGPEDMMDQPFGEYRADA